MFCEEKGVFSQAMEFPDMYKYGQLVVRMLRHENIFLKSFKGRLILIDDLHAISSLGKIVSLA